MGTTPADLEERVAVAFARRDPALVGWPDPHPDRSPLEEEYSRLNDPGKWRILGARADSWVSALVELGLATAEPVEPDDITWRKRPFTVVTSAALVRPTTPGALPLIVGRSRMEDVPDAGVTLGLGTRPVFVGGFPNCGCDACDSGSEDDLRHLDEFLRAIVTGRYRRLTKRRRHIVVVGQDTMSWTGGSGMDDVQAVLNDPRGWQELSGASWLA